LTKVCEYKEKVELQSEKLCSHLPDEDSELLEKVIGEDSDIYYAAIECCEELRDQIEKLMSWQKESEAVKQEPFPIESAFERLRQEVQDLRSDQRRKLPKRESGNFRVPRCNVNVPKLELSSFGGDRTKRIEFWDSFDSSVHTNGSLTNVDKFNYLKGKVFGQAREVISGLALTNENYILAVNILKEGYRNVQ